MVEYESFVEEANTSNVRYDVEAILEDQNLPWTERQVITFTDAFEPLYDMKNFGKTGHVLICGVTRSGKTTLLLSIIKKYLDNNALVLFRDDGGGEFRHLAYYYEDAARVFVPKGCKINSSIKFHVQEFDWKNPSELVNAVYKRDYPFNVICFDPFVDPFKPQMLGVFYRDLFAHLLFTLQKKNASEKIPLIFCIDEINDIAAPKAKGFEMSLDSKSLIAIVLRKCAKHNVKVIATTHRMSQVSLDVRTQMEAKIMKRSSGHDAWLFMREESVTFNKWAYIKLWKHIVTMPPENFVYFDRTGFFDYCTFDDIPRVEGEYECIGVAESGKDISEMKKKMKEIEEKVLEAKKEGWSIGAIARMLGISSKDVEQIIEKAEGTETVEALTK